MSVIPGGNNYYITSSGGGGTASNVLFLNSNATTSNVPSVVSMTREVDAPNPTVPEGPNFVVESHWVNDNADMCFRIWNQSDQTYFRNGSELAGLLPPPVASLGQLNFQGSPRFETIGQSNGDGLILKSTAQGWTNLYSDLNGNLYGQSTNDNGDNWSLPFALTQPRTQVLVDVEPNGTRGGFAPVVGSYFPRVLNTGIPALVGGGNSEVIPGLILSGNQITLADGTYQLDLSAPGVRVGRHKIRLFNLMSGQTEILGQNAYANDGDFDASTSAIATGSITVVNGPKIYELQHCVQMTMGNYDLGLECGFGDDEVYAWASITKVA